MLVIFFFLVLRNFHGYRESVSPGVLENGRRLFTRRKMATSLANRTCETAGCNIPANLQCPTCIKLEIAGSYFCSQVIPEPLTTVIVFISQCIVGYVFGRLIHFGFGNPSIPTTICLCPLRHLPVLSRIPFGFQ